MPPKKSTATAAATKTRPTRAAASKAATPASTPAATPATTSKANGKKRAAANDVETAPAKKAAPAKQNAKKTAKKVTSEEDEQDAGDVNEREIIASLSDVSADSSDDDDDDVEEEVNSSDEDDEDDRLATQQPRSSLASVKLPNSKDDAVVRARLDKLRKAKASSSSSASSTVPGVLYIGRLPKGFFEKQLKSYFSQFGDVTRLRVSRNKKTGASKHYAFVEFADRDVATIVQETMHNYLIDGRLLQVKEVPKDKVHLELWVGANRKFAKVPGDRIERVVRSRVKTVEEQERTNERKMRRQEARRENLKRRGIEYDFEGYTNDEGDKKSKAASKAKSTPVKAAKAKTAKA